MSDMKKCLICPRNCGVNRTAGITGVCGMTDKVMISRAALHYWEEPCISGYFEGQMVADRDCNAAENCEQNKKRGSGAVFFTGCNLGCIYCQNVDISGVKQNYKSNSEELPLNDKNRLKVPWKTDIRGKEVTIQELADIFLRLQNRDHAYNINLVTGVHFVPQIAEALTIAKKNGLNIPIIYNSSGYEKTETLRLLDGLIDVYLPDMKYISEDLAAEYSRAMDYPEISKSAIKEMYRQVGDLDFYEIGDITLIKRGVIVRNLLLPGHVRESERVIEYLYETYGDSIYISLMSQYTPMSHMAEHPLLGRRITRREYDRLLDYALNMGISNAFIQDRHVAKESFVPEWDLK
mgnify:CR=1 FL=1